MTLTDNPFEPEPRRHPFTQGSESAPVAIRAPAAEVPSPAAGLPGLPADLPSRQDARPVALRYRPGAAAVLWDELSDPTLRQVVQALCRALTVQPAALAFAAHDQAAATGDGAWVMTREREDAPPGPRLCRVFGLTAGWLTAGRDQLIDSGWRFNPPPPPIYPPPTSH
jgi:hypothetical protein